MNQAVIDYFRCPDQFVSLTLRGRMPDEPGFFNFRPELTCYEGCLSSQPASNQSDELHDAMKNIEAQANGIAAPFDPTSIIDNLRLERYRNNGTRRVHLERILKDAYYFLRPITPSSVRSMVQRLYFRGWEHIQFPRWPIDLTVDQLLESLLTLLLKNAPPEGIPFIWFWPDGFTSCAAITHDVETKVGRDFCPTLMDMDDSFAIKSSFQLVPEQRYEVSRLFLQRMKDRGFEVNIHDLNHDGRLFRDRATFLARAGKINQYAKEYGASGFRAGAMYREAEWLEALDVDYDMSIPNAAHMEPQRGGCCTVMPYFIGNILELPLTTTQDWALFNVLRQSTIDLWKREVELITEAHGLATFIVHPDYLIPAMAQRVYRVLLTHLSDLRAKGTLWIATPGQVNTWWRQRANLQLVHHQNRWMIVGPGSERARLAYARLNKGRVSYVLEDSSFSDPHNLREIAVANA